MEEKQLTENNHFSNNESITSREFSMFKEMIKEMLNGFKTNINDKMDSVSCEVREIGKKIDVMTKDNEKKYVKKSSFKNEVEEVVRDMGKENLSNNNTKLGLVSAIVGCLMKLSLAGGAIYFIVEKILNGGI